MNATELSQTPRTDPSIDPLPANLDSPRSKLIYLYLAVRGEATADEIRATLGITGLSLFPTLDVLREIGLVERSGNAYSVIA